MGRVEGFHVGDLVMAIRDKSESLRRYYPERGTIGIVTGVCDAFDSVLIQWPSGSTSGDDCWICGYDGIQLLTPYSEVQTDTTEIDLFLSEWKGV
jgi:hypothetical protein